MSFAHLHLHTEYSLLDGACRINKLVERAAELGFKELAITDHGNMFGCVDFYKAAKKSGIKPIIGCEVYVAKRTLRDKVHALDSHSNHLVLLCKNKTGYQNLIKMLSVAYTEGFYNKARVDLDLLSKHSDGLVALSACLAGAVPSALLDNDYDKAKEIAQKYSQIFGKNNFFIELQNHGFEEQKQLLPILVNLAKELDLPIAATNDCHYIDREDSKMQKILLCIQTNHTLSEGSGIDFGTDEFYLKSESEMRELFKDYPEACNNTAKIADMCNFDFEFGNTKLPRFDIPSGQDHFEYFKEQCYKGLYKNYGPSPNEEIINRLNYELEVIQNMGYTDYYLIVNDFVQYAKSKGIPVGPGRGSGAGSIAAYCIGITGVDPIQYKLLFERFLNPERVSMPDFDIDFCYERRQEVIDYVINKYGASHVAQIITFGTMAARGSVRDVGRVLGLSYQFVDQIAKLIPMEIGMNLNKALTQSQELRKLYDTDENAHELLNTAIKIEGMPRQSSTHAAGVVITDKEVSHYVPLAKNNDIVVTQYTMSTLEELGLLKMDFLGLRTLTVLHDTEVLVRQNHPEFCLTDINISDKSVYDMLSKGDTVGVFQFESAGMVKVLTQLHPENIEDLIAVISLYRPGPMDAIPMYIQNRHNPDKISYLHPSLEEILKVTYGCIVYQEQVMQIFRSLAGYSLGRADIVRRAMSKKKHDVMAKERDIFINGLCDDKGNIIIDGTSRRGIPESIANSIFSQMESFASYAFNKSHATAYAILSYQTAFMKKHYKREFMAALLTSVLDNSGKISLYLNECEISDIKVLPPCINKSDLGFTVCEGFIRFGLLAIKNLGKSLLEALLDERQTNGEFLNFYNFCKRMHSKDFNKRAVENLIKSGALDCFGNSRKQMLLSMESILNSIDNLNKKNLVGQLSFFDDNSVSENTIIGTLSADSSEFSSKEKLHYEKESIGIYLSGHPVLEYKGVIKQINSVKIADVISCSEMSSKYKDGSDIKVLCVLSKVRAKITKNNNTMAFVTIEDDTASLETIVFPKVYEKFNQILKEDTIVVIHGKLNLKEGEDVKIICEEIFLVDEYVKIKIQKNTNTANKSKSLYLKVPSLESMEYLRAKRVLDIFDAGKTPVYFYLAESKKLLLSPKPSWVDLNEIMLKELKNILNEDNVAVKLN